MYLKILISVHARVKMPLNVMLVARKASCCVVNTFSTGLEVIWPRSSLKITKMSTKLTFCKEFQEAMGKVEWISRCCEIEVWLDVPDMPSVCVCGDHFNVDHAMICKRGGFVIQRVWIYHYSADWATRSVRESRGRPRNSVGRVTVDLVRRSWVRFLPRSK